MAKAKESTPQASPLPSEPESPRVIPPWRKCPCCWFSKGGEGTRVNTLSIRKRIYNCNTCGAPWTVIMPLNASKDAIPTEYPQKGRPEFD